MNKYNWVIIPIVIGIIGICIACYYGGFNAGSEQTASTYFNQGKEGLTFEYSGTVNVLVSDNTIEIQFPDLKD